LEKLRGIGTIVGCNALYREFSPDLLIAIDAKMIKEIGTAKYPGVCLTPANRQVAIEGALKWRTNRFNTSGCFGLKVIAEIFKPKICYMIGMDGYPGNMYDSTPNYSPNTLQNFTGINNYYLSTLSSQQTDTVFVNVNTQDKWPDEIHNTGKYKFMLMQDFKEKILGE
jgi:hypothetical protein